MIRALQSAQNGKKKQRPGWRGGNTQAAVRTKRQQTGRRGGTPSTCCLVAHTARFIPAKWHSGIRRLRCDLLSAQFNVEIWIAFLKRHFNVTVLGITCGECVTANTNFRTGFLPIVATAPEKTTSRRFVAISAPPWQALGFPPFSASLCCARDSTGDGGWPFGRGGLARAGRAGLSLHFARAAPALEEWSAVKPLVSELASPGTLIVVAPNGPSPMPGLPWVNR